MEDDKSVKGYFDKLSYGPNWEDTNNRDTSTSSKLTPQQHLSCKRWLIQDILEQGICDDMRQIIAF